MKRVSNPLKIALLAILLTGCFGDSSPSESDARSAFEDQLGQQFQDGIIRVNYFKKTNGVSRESAGAEIYTYMYEAETEYPNGLNTQCISKNGGFAGWDCWLVNTAEMGETTTKNGEISFTLTENGWQVRDENIYSDYGIF